MTELKNAEGKKLALSIREPWAYLICAGYKDVENRDRLLSVRKLPLRIYVHAGQTAASSNEHARAFSLLIRERGSNEAKKVMQAYRDAGPAIMGAIIGEVTIVNCLQRLPGDRNNLYSNWHEEGKWGLILSRAELYEKPIPCSGSLGFFVPQFRLL